MAKIQAIRGMNDVLPDASHHLQYLESTFRNVLSQYGYQELRMPPLEKTELFKRGIGDVTDIVEKEMYTFEDRNGDSLSLRPEGTASCVRACLEHGLIHNQIRRLYYMGEMFRHERPQKGRYRLFRQLGVEVFGLNGPDIDAELIAMTAALWQKFGLQDSMTLEINTLGTNEERKAYREKLVAYLSEHEANLDEDSKRRLTTNPLRVLDSKNPDLKSIIQSAPKMLDHLGEASKAHFEEFCARLDKLGVAYTVNPSLVRGLDYYTHTVFEWVTTDLGAQGTVCAGGRYNGLVEQFGGSETPAVGFALGIERLLLLLAEKNLLPEAASPDLYCMAAGEGTSLEMMLLVQKVRQETTQNAVLHCGGGGFKSLFKKADKSGARLALILGEDELANNTVVVKYLREDKPQVTIKQSDLIEWLNGEK